MPAMSADEIKATIRRFVEELYSKGNTAIAGEMLAPSFVDHTAQPPIPPDRQGLLQDALQMRAAFPDLRITVDDMVIEGDKVAVLTTMSGTHEGEYYGVPIPPSHKRATSRGITLVRFSDGKIAEWWSYADVLGWLQQLGAFPGAALGQETTATQPDVLA